MAFFSYFLYKKLKFNLNFNFLFNFENCQVPVIHPVLWHSFWVPFGSTIPNSFVILFSWLLVTSNFFIWVSSFLKITYLLYILWYWQVATVVTGKEWVLQLAYLQRKKQHNLNGNLWKQMDRCNTLKKKSNVFCIWHHPPPSSAEVRERVAL